MSRLLQIAFISVLSGFWPAIADAGEDNQVAQAAAMPEGVPAIGRVHQGSGRYCTGTLVARNTVVTAAHCLVDPLSKHWIRAESLHFLGGYQIGEYAFHARVVNYTVSPAYDPNEPVRSIAADWAVLELTDTPEEGAPLHVKAPDRGSALGEVTGYALQRKYAQTTTAPCKLENVGVMLIGDCKAQPGMSGAPLLDVATGEMFGIQVAAGRKDGRDFLVAVPSGTWEGMVAAR